MHQINKFHDFFCDALEKFAFLFCNRLTKFTMIFLGSLTEKSGKFHNIFPQPFNKFHNIFPWPFDEFSDICHDQMMNFLQPIGKCHRLFWATNFLCLYPWQNNEIHDFFLAIDRLNSWFFSPHLIDEFHDFLSQLNIDFHYFFPLNWLINLVIYFNWPMD